MAKLDQLSSSDFASVCQTSHSLAEICRRVGMTGCGPAHKSIRHRAQTENVDLTHIPVGLGSNRGRHFPTQRTTVERVLLAAKDRKHIKKVLLREGAIANRCSVCKCDPVWQGKPLVMRLDHINGDANDNRLENLRLVCPNCDSQLDTFAGRNTSRPRRHCLDCLGKVTKGSVRCMDCEMKRPGRSRRKIEWPPEGELNRMISVAGYSAAGRQLGVSDNAIRKHLVRLSSTTSGVGDAGSNPVDHTTP
jgi:hypothetical protein